MNNSFTRILVSSLQSTLAQDGWWSVCVVVVYSDYGYESLPSGDDCVVSAWFDPNEPIEDCQVGQQYLKSRGSVDN